LPSIAERAGFPDAGGDVQAAIVSAALHVEAPALLVEARFRDVTLATCLLRADQPGAFTVGAARGADAPINPAWLADPGDAGDPSLPRRHALIQRAEQGFVVNLTAPMRAELRTPLQRLALAPDQGHAESPLVLLPDALLHIPCGEVTFDLRAADPAAAVTRPWISPRWREGARYPLAVALGLGLLALLIAFIPSDPHALSLDLVGGSPHFDRTTIIPSEIKPPELDRALGAHAPGGAAAAAAAGATGQMGRKDAPRADGRRAVKGPAPPTNALEARAQIQSSGILAALNSPRTGALAAIMADGSALPSDAETAFGHMSRTTIADAYGVGGIGVVGTGAGGGGEFEHTLGLGGPPGLGTIGRFGGKDGPGSGYGGKAGGLTRHVVRAVPGIYQGVANVRGSLDKEIIRRIVRQHLNEVRFCYEEALAGHPQLGGRIVVQFSIAGTGRVLTSVLNSSTVGAPKVDACVVNAVKRWEFPKPNGGGLVIVSYPFQLTPAGS
jgi:TonB family protein